MPKRKRFATGPVIWNMDDLYRAIERGECVMLRDKPLHPRFVFNMTMLTTRGFVQNKMFHYAIDTGPYDEDSVVWRYDLGGGFRRMTIISAHEEKISAASTKAGIMGLYAPTRKERLRYIVDEKELPKIITALNLSGIYHEEWQEKPGH